MCTITTIYWISLGLLVWVFFGYPILMLALDRLKSKPNTPSNPVTDLPVVTLLICAYNEERVIAQKIENSLALDYPDDKLRIVVVSDGSSDRTNEIAESYDDPCLTFLAYPDRGGKAKALNTGMTQVTGEIVVFTDANVLIDPGAIRKLIAPFDDPKIGGVVGNVVLRSPDGSLAGEGIYSRYEKAVHAAEANLATMITVDGAMYALRRDFVRPIPQDSITDDWYLATGALLAGKRIAWAPEAVGYEDAAASVAGEFGRKVRMVAGGYQTMIRRAGLFLNPVRHPVIGFMFVSHKLLRWLAMVFMATLCISNVPLAGCGTWYLVTLVGQVAFYILALAGLALKSVTSAAPVYVPYYFVAVNWGALLGLGRYLTRSQKAAWAKSRG